MQGLPGSRAGGGAAGKRGAGPYWSTQAAFNFQQLRPLLPYLKKYRVGYAIGAIAAVLNHGSWLLFPQVIRHAIDDLQAGVTPHKLLVSVLLLAAVALIKGIFQFLNRWIVMSLSRQVEFDLRNDLFKHLEKLDSAYFARTRTGDIMARATNDLNAVRMLLGPAIMHLANTVVFTLGAMAFMLYMSPKLTFYTLLPLPIGSIVVRHFGQRIYARFERVQAMFSDVSARVQENLAGIRVVHSYAQEQPQIASFETANLEYLTRSIRLVRLMGVLWPTLRLILGLSMVLVLWLGGREVLLHRLSVGSFVAFNTYMLQLAFPVLSLGWMINVFQRGMASMGRVNEILTEKPAIVSVPELAPEMVGETQGARSAAGSLSSPPSAAASSRIHGEIEFRKLSFAYSNGRQGQGAERKEGGAPLVLCDINLRIPAGTSLAIVGPTGSGKTTLVSLIPRIYDAEPGTVVLDGRPIDEYPLEVLRAHIGFVPQETFLFSTTIRENISLGVEKPSFEQVQAAAEGAYITADVEGFAEKYGTMVGERGITLSGGQKQRLAIARALIRNPPILVLDDALSSVDTETEAMILNHLRGFMRGRTTIFVSHRVSTVRAADAIAVLDAGRIVELGTHEHLLTLDGYYTRLHRKQLLEEELARA